MRRDEGFERSQVGGRRAYDILIELLDPALVKFEFQMSTIAQGFVAHEYFTKYPGRFKLDARAGRRRRRCRRRSRRRRP